MKHIFLGERIEKYYFLGVNCKVPDYADINDYWVRSNKRWEYERYLISVGLSDYRPTKIKYDENRHNFSGEVLYKLRHSEWKVISQTEQLIKELDVDEFTFIDNTSYRIERKSYGVDGNIYYYTDYQEHFDNEESLKIAEEELNKRQEFLKNNQKSTTQRVSEQQVQQVGYCDDLTPITKNHKSWWRRFMDGEI